MVRERAFNERWACELQYTMFYLVYARVDMAKCRTKLASANSHVRYVSVCLFTSCSKSNSGNFSNNKFVVPTNSYKQFLVIFVDILTYEHRAHGLRARGLCAPMCHVLTALNSTIFYARFLSQC